MASPFKYIYIPKCIIDGLKIQAIPPGRLDFFSSPEKKREQSGLSGVLMTKQKNGPVFLLPYGKSKKLFLFCNHRHRLAKAAESLEKSGIWELWTNSKCN